MDEQFHQRMERRIDGMDLLIALVVVFCGMVVYQYVAVRAVEQRRQQEYEQTVLKIQRAKEKGLWPEEE